MNIANLLQQGAPNASCPSEDAFPCTQEGNPAKISSYLSKVYAELATCQQKEQQKEKEKQEEEIRQLYRLSKAYAELATRQQEEQQKEKEKQEEEIRQLRWTPAKYSRCLSEAYRELVTRPRPRREEEEEGEEEEEEEEDEEEEAKEEEAYGTITVTASGLLNVLHPNSQLSCQDEADYTATTYDNYTIRPPCCGYNRRSSAENTLNV
ncbi:hypothetical protein ACMFMG_011815 [Clarireedia jacksonii]